MGFVRRDLDPLKIFFLERRLGGGGGGRAGRGKAARCLKRAPFRRIAIGKPHPARSVEGLTRVQHAFEASLPQSVVRRFLGFRRDTMPFSLRGDHSGPSLKTPLALCFV